MKLKNGLYGALGGESEMGKILLYLESVHIEPYKNLLLPLKIWPILLCHYILAINKW